MEREEREYWELYEARQMCKAVYFDDLRRLRETKAPRKEFEKKFDERIATIDMLTRMMEASPFHQKKSSEESPQG